MQEQAALKMVEGSSSCSDVMFPVIDATYFSLYRDEYDVSSGGPRADAFS